MNNNKSFFNNIKWIYSISSRFARVDRKSKSAATSKLASIGICFGVMTLIVVMSIMNGFQLSFIDSIMELSSYHIQGSEIDEDTKQKLQDFCNENQEILCMSPFYEAQTLLTSEYEKQCPAIIRAIDPECYEYDKGFRKELTMRIGYFDLEEENSIILGTKLARDLGVRIGDTVNLYLLSGSSDVNMFSSNRNFIVTGIFKSGYAQLNATYCYINLSDGKKYFGENAKEQYGFKLNNREGEQRIISKLNKLFPQSEFHSWREYNKAFFGALRIEKNMLLLLVAIIFLVVGINIYNGMRRVVFERRSEIAILSALGGTNSQIKSIFIMRGFTIGLTGALAGVALGLLLSVNTDFLFKIVSSFMYYCQYLITAITSPENLMYITENSYYALFGSIPARIIFKEVIMISVFGLISPLFASWFASKNVLKLTISEVLHNE